MSRWKPDISRPDKRSRDYLVMIPLFSIILPKCASLKYRNLYHYNRILRVGQLESRALKKALGTLKNKWTYKVEN